MILIQQIPSSFTICACIFAKFITSKYIFIDQTELSNEIILHLYPLVVI